jgi:drug/metabolite transporter (DMT)-like permease
LINQPTAARWSGLFFLCVTALGWAINFAAIKLLLREWPPLFSRGVAGVAAALILAGVAGARHESLKVPRGAIGRLGFAAFTNVFAWMGFSTVALKYLSVGEALLLVYTMPIWSMLLAWPILGARPTVRDIVSLLLGLSGLVVLFGHQGLAIAPDRAVGIALVLSAAVLFALGGVMTKTPLPVAPIALVAWQVGLGCLPMVILGLLFEHPDFAALSHIGLSVLIFMTIVPMGICYLTWFAALRRLPPATASVGILMTPIIGVIVAALLLGEPLGYREAAALALTLGGVALALLRPHPAAI